MTDREMLELQLELAKTELKLIQVKQAADGSPTSDHIHKNLFTQEGYEHISSYVSHGVVKNTGNTVAWENDRVYLNKANKERDQWLFVYTHVLAALRPTCGSTDAHLFAAHDADKAIEAMKSR